MLPRTLPRPPGVEFGAVLRPSLHLAGDFYNVFRLDQHRVGFYLGDVMGHGPAAALLGVFAMLVFQPKKIEGTSYEILPPALALEALNRELLAADFPGGPFITMIYGVLDTQRRVWTYCAAGHPPALLLRKSGRPITLDSNSPLLGVVDGPFVQKEVSLQPGDRIVLYSDGIDLIEWADRGRGIGGLINLLSERDGGSPQELLDSALQEAASAIDPPPDDLALLIAQVEG